MKTIKINKLQVATGMEWLSRSLGAVALALSRPMQSYAAISVDANSSRRYQ